MTDGAPLPQREEPSGHWLANPGLCSTGRTIHGKEDATTMTAPLFSKRHYEFLAEVFYRWGFEAPDNNGYSACDAISLNDLTTELARDNPGFNKEKFLRHVETGARG